MQRASHREREVNGAYRSPISLTAVRSMAETGQRIPGSECSGPSARVAPACRLDAPGFDDVGGPVDAARDDVVELCHDGARSTCVLPPLPGRGNRQGRLLRTVERHRHHVIFCNPQCEARRTNSQGQDGTGNHATARVGTRCPGSHLPGRRTDGSLPAAMDQPDETRKQPTARHDHYRQTQDATARIAPNRRTRSRTSTSGFALRCETESMRGKRVRSVAFSVVMLFGIAGMTGCVDHSSGPHRTTSPAPVITAVQARAIVAGFWPMREQALVTLDLKRINQLEAGVAGTIDTAITNDILGRMPQRNLATVRDHGPIMVFVPRQTHYPATFLAEVITTRYGSAESMKEIMVFRRQQQSDTWRLVLDAGSDTTTVDTTGMGSGFDAQLPHFAGQDAANWPGQLADYWQSWWTTGHSPRYQPFAPGYWTTQRGALIARSARGRPNSHCGCSATLRYQPYPQGGTFAYNTHGGGLLECFATKITDTSVPAPGSGLAQDIGRNNWGAPLAPGIYQRIQMTTIRPSCVYANPPTGLPLDVLGGEDGNITVSGMPGCRADQHPSTSTPRCLRPSAPAVETISA